MPCNSIRLCEAKDPAPGLTFPRVATRHSNLRREDFAARLECARGKHGTDRHSGKFAGIRGKSPQPNPTVGRGTSSELAHNVGASVLILQTTVRPQTTIQRLAWFRSYL